MYYNLLFPNFTFAHKFDETPSKNGEFEYHVHMIYEILFFIRGRASFVIENRRFELRPGDLLFIPPGQHHNINLDYSTPYERYVLKFPEYAVPESLLPTAKTKFGSYKIEDAALLNFFSEMDAHVQRYKGKDLCGLLTCKLNEILYYFCHENAPHEFEIYNENMTELINYINQNIAGRLTLEEISKRFHYSKSYICKEFRSCMKAPIMRYIRTKKILMAESLIKSGKKPNDIFEQCGFSDYSTFFRAYKKLLGKAPSRKTPDKFSRL
ncbi:MAG: AraC family transcriptional regulator [Clostridiales bacterium]|jgi:AraC-like DNA-binding protein|nr:AraC family transcriptional regulator [Clostridiales bacterium]